MMESRHGEVQTDKLELYLSKRSTDDEAEKRRKKKLLVGESCRALLVHPDGQHFWQYLYILPEI